MATAKAQKTAASEGRVLEQKLGKTHFNAGWTAVPNVFFQRQQALGLDSLDLNIIMLLTTYWWRPGDKPFPSKKAIAKAIDCDPSTVRRRIKKLEGAKLITRVKRHLSGGGQTSNAYDLLPLLKQSEKFSEEELQRRAARRKENMDKLSRKGKLQLVKKD